MIRSIFYSLLIFILTILAKYGIITRLVNELRDQSTVQVRNLPFALTANELQDDFTARITEGQALFLSLDLPQVDSHKTKLNALKQSIRAKTDRLNSPPVRRTSEGDAAVRRDGKKGGSVPYSKKGQFHDE